MSPDQANQSVIETIRGRGPRLTLGGCGIRLASDYVRGVLSAAGMDGAVMFPDPPSLLKEAESRLVYRNDDMTYDTPRTSIGDIKQFCDAIGVEVPPRTLMVNELIVTSTKEDRDGDRLHAKGAIVDPKMPGLWHHMLPSVVGKMLTERPRDDKHVRIGSAIMESPLGIDVANLVEFGALRISHGFRPLEFTPRDKGLHDRGPRGFDITSFEVLEFSYVSVPSNTEAEIIAWSRGKVHTPVVKSWCRSLYDQRKKVYPSGVAQNLTVPIELKLEIRGALPEDGSLIDASDEASVRQDVMYTKAEGKPDMALTEEQKRLGADAAAQAAKGENPPTWAVDEDKWERAKEAADKTYDREDDVYWPVVVHIYQNMGGTIQGKSEKTAAPAEKPGESKAMDEKEKPEAVECPECGETVVPDEDGKCPECGAATKIEKSADVSCNALSDCILPHRQGVSSASTKAPAPGQGQPMIELIDSAKQGIQIAVSQLDSAASHVGDVRAYFVSGGEKAAGNADHCTKLAAAVQAIADAKTALADADKSMDGIRERMTQKDGTGTKAGRVLSAANEANLRAALAAIHAILEQVAAPVEAGTYKPLPEPAAPPAAPKPKTEEGNPQTGPAPVELTNPDGSTSIAAACQSIVRRMIGQLSTDDTRALARLGEAIAAETRTHERARRREALLKLLRV